MKHLKLFFALFAMLALGVGNAWGATYSLTPNKAGTGLSNTAYITSLTEFTNNGISWKMNQWNPSSLQIKTNQGSAANEWRFYNTSAIPGKITKVVIKFSALTLKNTSTTGFKFVGGSSAVTGTTGGTDGVWNASAKTLTWTPTASDNFTYFALYQNGKVATGTNKLATSDAIVVTYETSGDEETVPSLTEEQFSWSAAAATATLPDKFDEKPTLTNTEDLAVSYSTSNDKVATIDADGNVKLVGVGTADIKATAGDGVTFEKTTVAYTLTVKPAPLVIEPIEGGIIDILTHKTFAATSNQYTDFTNKQAANENHSEAVYAGRSARNGNATQYSIQLNTIDKGRIATTTTGGLAKRVYVKWSTQETLNTNARELYIYGSNTAFAGSETTAPSTKIGAIKYTTGAAEAYVDLTGDYKYILMTGSGAIYMDEIHVTWVSAAGTVVTPTISGEAEFVESTEVSIATETGYKVYYTLNGTDPTNASTEYTAPFTVNTTTTVKAIAYDGASASDVVSVTFKKLQSLTCAEAAALCTTTESADKYVIRGYVTSIPYPYSASNTTPTFWMADSKNGGEVIQAYKVTPIEDADKAVIVGDQVQVIGKIKLYSTTPEVNTGIYTITVKNPEYNVNITSAHGTVTATPAPAVEGAEVTLTLEDLESGWVFQSWTVTDASSNPIEVVDNKFTMPASDVTVVANYTESVAPDAVLKLSANGTIISEATYKVGETVELPANIANDCVKMFVGWSADANCTTAPEYAPGADFELTAAEHTLYAVYASGTTGETVTIKHNVPTTGTSTNMTGNNDANKFFGLDADAWSVVAAKGGASNNVGINKDGTIRLYYHASGGNTLTVTAPSKVATIKLTYNSTYTNAWVKVNGNKVTPTDGVYTIDAETFVIGNANTENVRVHIKNIAVTLAGALADFSTTCSGALAAPTFSVAEGTYNTAQSIEITAAEGTIYYTLDGSTPTSESDVYSSEAIVLDECGELTIKAIAISNESESPVASATYTIDLPIPANSETDPYTETEAVEVYNGGCYDGAELVYVKGTVKTATFYSSGTYTITLTNGFQFYKFYKTAGKELFTDGAINAGDVLVACGKLSKYNTTYQLAEGCYLVAHEPYTEPKVDISNDEASAYTVDKAFELIDDVSSDLTKTVYVKGLVAVAPTSNPTEEGQMTYSISDNGENTGNVLKVYLGLNLNGEKFTSKNDVQLGDYVVVKGQLLDYNGTYELNKGNQLVQHKKAATITIADITMEVGETKTIAATITPDAAKTEVTYSIKAGSDDCITLSENNITAKAEGTATIVATIATAAEYMGKTVEFTVTVNPVSTKEKVVILAKYGDQWYAMMAQYVSGKTSHLAALPVTYVGGKLYNVADADKTLIEWECAVVDGKATFSNNSKYLTGKSDKTDLTLAATSCNWTISGDSYLIGARTFLYNAENNWFRNFGTSNADNKNYSGMPTVTAPVYATGDAYGRSVNLGEDGYRYGTICLPFGSTNYTGAEFFECVGKEEGKVYLGSVTTLVAGTPYIFKATGTELAVYSDGTTAATPGSKNGLVGTFTNDTEVAIDNYILKDNAICKVAATCWVNAYRAYIVMEDVPTGVPTQMPDRRYIGMSVQGENEATGFENITAPAGKTVKAIVNGQLIIIRDGEMYNAQGVRL